MRGSRPAPLNELLISLPIAVSVRESEREREKKTTQQQAIITVVPHLKHYFNRK